MAQLVQLVRSVAEDGAEVAGGLRAQHYGQHPGNELGLVELAACVEKGAQHLGDGALRRRQQRPQLAGEVKVRPLCAAHAMRVVQCCQCRQREREDVLEDGQPGQRVPRRRTQLSRRTHDVTRRQRRQQEAA